MILFDEHTYSVELDENTHIYTVTAYLNGRVVWVKERPSATQVLKSVGIIDYRGVDEYYRERGTLVHDYCTLYATGRLGKVREDCKVYVDNFKRIVEALRLSYVSSEVVCYDPVLNVAGKYDLIMEQDGKRLLVELKTGIPPQWLGLQTAAYENMVEVDGVLGISLKEGKVFEKADDYYKNHDEWVNIRTGMFDLEEWKSDKKRRRMRRVKW